MGFYSPRKKYLTSACSSTMYALSTCVHARASHFRTQAAIAYIATEAGVGMIPFVNRGDKKSANRS